MTIAMESPKQISRLNCQPSSKPDCKRKRATRACLNCRNRKVRCDVVESEQACTNCRLDSLECVVPSRKQTRPMWNDGLRSFRRRHSSNTTSDAPGQEVRSEHGIERGSSLTVGIEDPDRSVSSQQSGDARDQGESSIHPNSQINNRGPDVVVSTPEHRSPATPPETHSPGCEFRSTDVQAPSQTKSRAKSTLPAFIKPLPEWLSSEDVNYLHSKNALTIPSDPFRGRLLQRFIEYVYGYMPLLDLKELLQAVEQEGEESGPRLSLLLFQAIMFAGSAFVDMVHLRAAGYSTRREARKDLFERVKLLYGFNIEQCDISIIQSMLLMTHWYHDRTSHKDLWCWMGIVTTMSQAGALHVPLDHHGFSLRQQRLRKRLGWCVFMRDQILALGMRRPARIQLAGHKIPILTLDDFGCDPLETTVLPSDCTVVRDPVQQRQLAALCIEICKLCVCMSLVLSTQYRPISQMLPGDDGPILLLVPRQEMQQENQFDVCNQQLENWKRNLPLMCMYDSISALSACESHIMVIHKALLKMMYLTVVASLYRPQIMPLSPWSPATSSIFKAARCLPATSQTKICSAASDISAIGNDLQKLGLVKYLPTSSMTAVLPALIIHLIHIAYAREEVVAQSMQHFSSGLAVLKCLSDSYASAELAVHFLEGTIDASNIQVNRATQLLHSSPQLGPRSSPQSTLPPDAYMSPGGEKRRSRSPIDSASSRKQPSQCATPTAKGHSWPEWSVWLEGESLEPDVIDPSPTELRGSYWELPTESYIGSLNFRPVSEDVDFFSADMRDVSDYGRGALGLGAELGNSRLSAKSTHPEIEVNSLLDSDTLLIPDIHDMEEIGPLISSHSDRFDELVN